MNLIHYLLEANLYLAAFYLLYVVFLRSETLYQLNRAYLLGCTLVAFVIPVLQLGMLKPDVHIVENVGSVSVDTGMVSVMVMPSTVIADAPKWTAIDYTLAVYGVITLAFFVLLIFKIAKLVTLSKKGNIQRRDGFKLVEIQGENAAFSFFGYLFVNPALSASQTIMHHEEVHIRQKHSWDVIYLELLKVFNWFNPAVYLLQKSLKEIHEFIADEQVAEAENGAADYADFLISNAYGITQSQLTNSFFNKNLLKRRIIMLYQKKSGRAARLKYLLTLPLAGGLLCASTLAFTTKNYGVVDLAPKRKILESIATNTVKFNSEPSYPGGTEALYKYLKANLNYSKIKEPNIENHLFMRIVVEKDGSLSDIKTLHAPGGNLSASTHTEITRVLKMGPKWIPGTRNGQKASIKYFVVFGFNKSNAFKGDDNSDTIAITTKKAALKDTTKSSDALSDYDRGRRDAERDMKIMPLVILNGKKTMLMPPPNFDWKQVDKAACASLLHVEPNEIKAVSILSPNLAIKMYGKSIATANGAVVISSTFNSSPKITPGVDNSTDATVYNAVDIQPNFPGGEAAFSDFLRRNIKYPKEAKDNNVQGRVFIQFIVEKDGSLSDLIILRDPGSGLGEEAVRVLNLSPKWRPGLKKNTPVRVQYTVPINFALADQHRANDIKPDAIVNQPIFPGGQSAFFSFLKNNIKYPAKAKENKISGKAYIQFIVQIDGSLSDFKIVREPGSGIGEEALRVMKLSPNWTPANSAGKNVRTTMTIPINFSLAE